MIFGSNETFAIEAMTEEGLALPSTAWGRMRVWCQGISIGDFSDEHCGLPYSHFLDLKEALPSLWLPEFEGMSALDLCNHLDRPIYGYHGDVELDDARTSEEICRDYLKYSKFSFLTNWGEMFDRDEKSFICCTPAGEFRVLNRATAPGRWLHARLPEALLAITGFLRWYEAECNRLGSPLVRTAAQ